MSERGREKEGGREGGREGVRVCVCEGGWVLCFTSPMQVSGVFG